MNNLIKWTTIKVIIRGSQYINILRVKETIQCNRYRKEGNLESNTNYSQLKN